MQTQRNESGLPLSGSEWLATHHRAKIEARRAFASTLAALAPKRVVDLGCASGLWLELLDEVLPEDCEFIGVDCDAAILEEARQRSLAWKRRARFELLDLNDPNIEIPVGDLSLLFNVCGFIEDLPAFLDRLHSSNADDRLAIRQYDGAMLRFGPMPGEARVAIESSLRAAVSSSDQLRHYDLDRVANSVGGSRFTEHRAWFELFERFTPYPAEFVPYLNGTLDWTQALVSDNAKSSLADWRRSCLDQWSYFVEVDYVALLS